MYMYMNCGLSLCIWTSGGDFDKLCVIVVGVRLVKYFGGGSPYLLPTIFISANFSPLSTFKKNPSGAKLLSHQFIN